MTGRRQRSRYAGCMQEGASSLQAGRRCRGCGNPVAHDHGDDLYCGSCQRARRDYHPSQDPDFADALLGLLRANKRRRVHVYRELGIESCGIEGWRCVRNHIARFRRHGVVISGFHDGTYIYRYTKRNARALVPRSGGR